eukprot:5540269-Amphidinium_carterae.1
MACFLLLGLVCCRPLVPKAGGHTVWTDGSGKHSRNPHFRRCGVGYVTDTGEKCWMALPGIRQSVFRAELLAVVRALEECQPRRVVSDCKGVVKALQAIQRGHRLPKGRHKDLEERARRSLTQDCRLQWVKAHQTRDAVEEGRITLEDFQGNLEADE